MPTRLSLSKDQFVDVKDKLRVRDKREVHTYSVDGVSSDGQTYRFNVVKHQIANAAVRIVNWLIRDEDGKPIPYPVGKATVKERIEAIEGLDEDIFEEVTKALSAFEKSSDEEAEEEKNETPDGEITSGPSSPSVN